MKQAFSLEQALSFPFSAPHRGSFFWQSGLCCALLSRTFWPILLAYAILAVGSTFVMQLIMGPAAETADGSEILPIFTSPGFLVSMGVLCFLMLFVQGIVQHVVGAPAALAARHDPRNDFGDAARVDMFS